MAAGTVRPDMKRLLLLTLLAVAASTAVADAAIYDLDKVLRDDIRRVAKRTDVPIRLPSKMNFDYDKPVYGNGSRTRDGYTFSVDATATCGGNACFIASFSAEEGGTPAFKRTVRLANGITGYYKPLSCGGSCSPPLIEWLQGGVLYSIQAKLGVAGRAKQRRAMIRAANEAIRSAPR